MHSSGLSGDLHGSLNLQPRARALAKALPLPGDDKEDTADTQVGEEHIHPDIWGQGVEEGEDTRVGAIGLAIQDADTECHKGLGEVDGLLADVGDRQGCHGQICLLQRERDRQNRSKA